MGGKYSREKRSGFRRFLAGLYGAVCVVLVVLLAFNITIIAKGAADPAHPPSVFGVTPMVVLSGSMSGSQEGHIEVGDLILTLQTDPAQIRVGDVISFMDGKSAVTHRVIGVVEGYTGNRFFETKGDANNAPDLSTVSQEQLIGKFWFRIPGLGDFALFLQQPLGMCLFAGVPLAGFLLYDIICRRVKVERELKQLREKVAESAEN